MSTLMELQRQDLRQLRVTQLANEIMRRAAPHLNDRYQGYAVEKAIVDVLMEAGAHLVTDFDRQQAGLPLRGSDGWTHEELRALELLRIQAILQPIPPIVIKEAEKQK